MVAALVFFTALAALAHGHHIALVPLAPSPMAKFYSPITAASPFAASVGMGIAGDLSAPGMADLAATRGYHALLAGSPAAAFLAPASGADPTTRKLGADHALNAAAILGSAAAFPDSWTAAKSIEAGAPAMIMVPVSAASPLADVRTIGGAVCADPASCGLTAAATRGLSANAPAAFIMNLPVGSPLVATRAIGAPSAASYGSLAPVLTGAESVIDPAVLRSLSPINSASPAASTFLPASVASPWARLWAASTKSDAFSPVKAMYVSGPVAAQIDAAEHAKAAGEAAARAQASYLAADAYPLATSDVFAKRAQVDSILKASDLDAIIASQSAIPTSSWIAAAPESAAAKLVRGSFAIPAGRPLASWPA